MSSDDRVSIFKTAFSIYDVVDDVKAMFYAEFFGDYGSIDLMKAIKLHVSDPDRGRYLPKPADILHKLPKITGVSPDSDEAWAIAVEAADEANTVIWTSEIAKAWNRARNVFDAGDVVGARMAFKATYERLVIAGEKVKWIVSAGHDSKKRATAIKDALIKKLITKEYAFTLDASLFDVLKKDPLMFTLSNSEKRVFDASILQDGIKSIAVVMRRHHRTN